MTRMVAWARVAAGVGEQLNETGHEGAVLFVAVLDVHNGRTAQAALDEVFLAGLGYADGALELERCHAGNVDYGDTGFAAEAAAR